MAGYERQDGNGLGWADQWDTHFNEDAKGTQRAQKSSKIAKVKDLANNGMEKTKVAATVSAQKVKSGTTTSIRWIKEKVQKKPQQ